VEADRELILGDAGSISEGLWRISRLAQDAAELLDARIEEHQVSRVQNNLLNCDSIPS
jgi:hypothetical protein